MENKKPSPNPTIDSIEATPGFVDSLSPNGRRIMREFLRGVSYPSNYAREDPMLRALACTYPEIMYDPDAEVAAGPSTAASPDASKATLDLGSEHGEEIESLRLTIQEIYRAHEPTIEELYDADEPGSQQ